MSSLTPTYAALEWQARKTFVRIITQTCHDRDIRLTWLSDHWIAKLERNNHRCYIHAYVFPLNNAASAAIMRDKVSTYEVLKAENLPAVPHYLLRLPADRRTTDTTEHLLQITPLPVVLKPNVSESGGVDVYKCLTKTELGHASQKLASRYPSIAVSPFTVITAEYRIVLLDGQPKVVFEKIPSGDQWQHNLKFGAAPQVVTDEALHTKLVTIARQALAIIKARVAAVDIIATPSGYQIMEINGGITLNLFSSYSSENTHIAASIYTDLVEASLQS